MFFTNDESINLMAGANDAKADLDVRCRSQIKDEILKAKLYKDTLPCRRGNIISTCIQLIALSTNKTLVQRP